MTSQKHVSKTENLVTQNMDILYTNRRVFERRLRKTLVPISENASTKRYESSKFGIFRDFRGLKPQKVEIFKVVNLEN